MTEESLLSISEEKIHTIRKRLNLDENRLRETVEDIKRWMALQPHLPDHDDYGRLERYLIRSENSVEKAKQTLDSLYKVRTTIPEVMCGWDVHEPWFDSICNSCYFVPMPKLTKDEDRILIYGYQEHHPQYDMLDHMKVVVQILEIRLHEDYNIKDIYVIDMKYFNIADCQKAVLPLMKYLDGLMLKEFTSWMRGIHIVNIPPYAQYVINIIKGITKSKFMGSFHVHGQDLTEFYQQVPKDLLPTELDGNAGSLHEHWERWQKKLRNKREWLLSREKIKTDESKRPGYKKTDNDLFGIEGSFRNITID